MKLSPLDVARLVNNQSQVIPTGEIRIGKQDYYVSSNAMVTKPEDFAGQPATLPKRFYRTGHISPTWYRLGGVWSPDPNYGVHTYAIYVRMLDMKLPKPKAATPKP